MSKFLVGGFAFLSAFLLSLLCPCPCLCRFGCDRQNHTGVNHSGPVTVVLGFELAFAMVTVASFGVIAANIPPPWKAPKNFAVSPSSLYHVASACGRKFILSRLLRSVTRIAKGGLCSQLSCRERENAISSTRCCCPCRILPSVHRAHL